MRNAGCGTDAKIITGGPESAEDGFKQSGTHYLTETGGYAQAVLSEERYVGDYNLAREIRMRSNYSIEKREDDMRLPCCSSGWADMSSKYKVGHSADSVFDCTCFEAEKNR